MPQPVQKESWWPTIGAIVLLIIIVLLGLFSYQSYVHNLQLAGENTTFASQIAQLTTDKETLTTQMNDLTKQLGKLECDGVWTGEKCDPYPVTLTTKVASGTSPFAAVFTIHTKPANFMIDFGEGTSTPLTAASSCTPKADGFCLLTVPHTYRTTSTSSVVFDVRLLKEGSAVAATSVTVTAKK